MLLAGRVLSDVTSVTKILLCLEWLIVITDNKREQNLNGSVININENKCAAEAYQAFLRLHIL